MFDVTSESFNKPAGRGFSRVYKFESRLFLLISAKAVEEGEIDMVGTEILSRISREYLNSPTPQALLALKEAISKISLEFNTKVTDLEIAGLATLDDVVYLATYGEAEVLIGRGGIVTKLVGGLHGRVSVASGRLKDGDVFMMATAGIFKTVPYGVIKASVSSPNPESAIEILTPSIQGVSLDFNLGVFLLHFKKLMVAQTDAIHKPVPPSVLPPKKTLSAMLKTLTAKIASRLPSRPIYIKSEPVEEVSRESKRRTFSVALLLLFLLVVSIAFGIRQKKVNDVKNKYTGIFQEAQNEVDQAISLASVSSEESRELLISAQEKLRQIESFNIKSSELDSLKNKISSAQSSILGEYRLTPELFLDLTLLTSGFSGNAVAFSEGKIYALDSEASRVVSAEVATKKSSVVAGPGAIDSPSGFAAYAGRAFVLQGDGVYEIGSSGVGSGSTKVVNKTWSGDAIISVFGANLYVVDIAGGQIYRYPSAGTSFGEKQNWLAGGVSANFSDAMQMVIDGAIYILFPNAKIVKFSQGSTQSFNVRGVAPEIGNIDALSASADNQYIYLLDRAGKRVVVTDKSGSFKAQYIDDQIASAVNLVASEKDRKIILLTGEKLISIEIKH